MIPLIVFFILLSVIGIFLWVFGKVKENTVAVIIFCSAIFCIVVPSLIQKTSLTYDKTPVENFLDAEVFYSETENKYYALTSDEQWEFWNLYDIKEIPEELLRERQKDNKTYKNLFEGK